MKEGMKEGRKKGMEGRKEGRNEGRNEEIDFGFEKLLKPLVSATLFLKSC